MSHTTRAHAHSVNSAIDNLVLNVKIIKQQRQFVRYSDHIHRYGSDSWYNNQLKITTYSLITTVGISQDFYDWKFSVPAGGMLKADKPQYTLDHDGNYIFVIHILGNPGAEFTASVDVRMQGKKNGEKQDWFSSKHPVCR